MKDLIKLVDDLPWIVKIILALPGLDIVWAIYRIIKGYVKKDGVLLIIGVIWVLLGLAITWIFDLVTTILYKHPKLT
ncbi:MAG: hypothetical protein IJ459_02605 [Clostridia bacterium]|nr:hypothetical protein [Clostridia bacterium]